MQCVAWERLVEEIQGDDKLMEIARDLLSDPLSHPGFQLKGGRLYHEGMTVIPKGSPRVDWVLHEFHDTAGVIQGI